VHYTLRFGDIFRNFDFFIEGIEFTVVLSVSAMFMALILGTIIAVARGSKIRAVKFIASTYVEMFRNTPLLIQIWLFYFGLGEIGIQIPAFACGLLALTLNTTAYTAEVLRAGYESVEKELKEAAASLGMTPWQTNKIVIFPLGFRAALPALCNMSILCLMASALISTLGVNEITNQTMRLSNKTFRSFESFIIAVILYNILTLCFIGLFGLAKKKMAKGSLH